MLIYDDSWVAAMEAITEEATNLGARVYGSEHLLLGLLRADDPVFHAVADRYPHLTVGALRTAIEQAVDDLPHLQRLGIASGAVPPPPSAESGRGRVPRARHTPELQAALNAACTKWGQLRKTRQITRQQKLSSAVLWLAVIEPPARASRLLKALNVDPDRLRSVVLATMVPTGQVPPAWPQQVRPSPVERLTQRFFTRATVAG